MSNRVITSIVCSFLALFLITTVAQSAPSQAEIDSAISKGLDWLAANQNEDGSFGQNYVLGTTAMVVLAFEENNHLPGKGALYSDAVQKGLDYILDKAEITDIEPQPAGNPDSDGDGKGLYFSYESIGYETAACVMAIIGSKSPDRIVNTGACYGWKYSDVVKDAVDYYAYAQDDPNDDWNETRGGWRYDANGESDNSVSQWPTHAMIVAEGWGIKAPAWVKNELKYWIEYIQNSDGSSGYMNPEDDPNIGKTGALLMEMYWVGDNQNTARAKKAISYMNNSTIWQQEPAGYDGNKGNSYSMFAVFKGLRMMNVQSLSKAVSGGDWWGDYTQWIIDHQGADGSWEGYYNQWIDAAWYIMILKGTLPVTINLTVKADPTSISADGKSTSTITATVKDASNNPMSGLNVTMLATKNLGEIGDVKDNKNGTYTAPYRASTKPGKETISVSVSGATKTVDITLTEVTQPTITLTLQADPSTLPADGKSTSTITATVKDSTGKPLAGQSVSMAVTKGKGTISKVADKGKGIYTATYIASNQAGTETVTATVSDVSKSVNIKLTAIETPDRKLIIPEVTASAGADVVVPVNITDASGISGCDLEITYDTDILTIKKVEITTLTNGFSISPNINTSGLVKISMAKDNPIANGSGAFVNMTFAVKAGLPSGTETPVNFKDASVFDANATSVPVDTQNGKVKIGIVCTKGDVNNDGKVNSADAILTLRIASNLLSPSEQQKCAADINSDNKVNAADAILVLRKASGLAPDRDPIAVSNGKVIVMIDDVYGKAGDIIAVPVKIDNADILSGGNITLTFDVAVLQVEEVSSDSDSLFVANIAEPGVIQIAFAGENKMENSILANIKFHILADSISPLAFRSVEFYGPDGLPIASRGINGKFASYLSRPKYSALMQNFPNPFNPETWIPYQLKEDAEVTIWILNAKGKIIRKLDLGQKPAGIYVNQEMAAYWDGKDSQGTPVASGVYFYSIKAGSLNDVKKMIVVK